MATVPSTQFAYRSYSNFKLVSGYPDYKPIPDFKDPEGNIKAFQYSKDGSYLGWTSPESVKIINTESSGVINELPKKSVIEIGFSPKGTYISTWERPVKSVDNSVNANLFVWEVATGKELISFVQKSQSNWNVQWTEDESFFSRLVTGEVHFYDSKNPDKGVHSILKIEGIGDFSLSPGKSSSVAVFIPEKNAAPAAVRIYSITNFNLPLSSKVFYKADKIQMKWNDLGTNLLVLTQTDVDKTNKSYYGETNLYFQSVAGRFDCRVQLDKEGPIHDVVWSPTSKEFIVIYGYMPAKATLFDHRAEPIHEFGINPRNTVKYNPQGRLILIAGFGNLAGTMDVWDRKTLEKIATIEAQNSSETFWSPDGRYIMTATLSPRLRVDNGYKIWHYTGAMIHTENIQELLQVQWRPANAELYPMRATLSPPPKNSSNSTVADIKPSPKKVGAYRPPHARGKATPEIFKREDESSKNSSQDHGNDVSSGTTENLSKTAVKNKKKREAAKKKKETVSEDTDAPATTQQPVIISNGAQVDVNIIKTAPTSISDVTSYPGSLTENEKKIRNLTKKLRQIEELKERQQSGDKLEKTQLQKIANEALLRKELEMLKL